MAYHYEWLVPKRVIFCYVSGSQDTEEVRQSNAELRRRLDQGEAPTHYIADVRQHTRLPTTNVRRFTELISFVNHPNLSWTVVIGRSNPMINFVFGLAAKLTRIRYRAVDTPQEAVAFLTTIDPTLDMNVDLEAFYAAFVQESL